MNSWRPVSIALLLVVDTEGGTLEGVPGSLLPPHPPPEGLQGDVGGALVQGAGGAEGAGQGQQQQGEGGGEGGAQEEEFHNQQRHSRYVLCFDFRNTFEHSLSLG